MPDQEQTAAHPQPLSSNRIIVGLFRALLLLAILLLSAAVGLLLLSFLRSRSKEMAKQQWAASVVAALGVKVFAAPAQCQNTGTGRLVVCNHVSFIDIPVLNSLQPLCFVSKADVASWPLIGWLARKSGTLFIERGNRRAAHRTQDAIMKRLLAGQDVMIFPEGTTSDGTGVLPFHAALFQAAIEANAEVQCLSLCYKDKRGRLSNRIAYVGDLTLLDCLWQVVTSDELRAEATYHPLMTPPHSDRRHLAKHAHRLVAHGLERALSDSAHSSEHSRR